MLKVHILYLAKTINIVIIVVMDNGGFFGRSVRQLATLKGAGLLAVTGSWLTFVSYQKHSAAVFLGTDLNKVFAERHIPLTADVAYPFPRLSNFVSLDSGTPYRILHESGNGTAKTFVLKAKLPESMAKTFPALERPREVEFFISSNDPSLKIDSINFDEILAMAEAHHQAPSAMQTAGIIAEKHAKSEFGR